MKNPEQTRHGRCGATNRQGEQCGRAAIGEHGKCGYHGGKTPMKHGIYSDVVREEDRAVLDALEDISTAKKLDETLNLQVMKLRRAVEMTNRPEDEADFWGLFEQLVASAADTDDLDPGLVRELSKMLQTPGRTQRELMDLIRKTAKTLHDITEGQDINVSHGVDEDSISELKDLAESAYE